LTNHNKERNAIVNFHWIIRLLPYILYVHPR